MTPSESPFAAHVPPRTSGVATASLVCGILSLPTLLTTAVAAIITGHVALSQIKKAGGALGGKGLAVAGLILGYGSLALIPLIAGVAGLVAPLVIRQRERADQHQCRQHMEQIFDGMQRYEEHQPSRRPEDLRELETLGYVSDLDPLLAVPVRHQGEWLYFPHAADSRSDLPLLISPALGRSYLVLSQDGAISTVRTHDLSRPFGPEHGAPVAIPATTR